MAQKETKKIQENKPVAAKTKVKTVSNKSSAIKKPKKVKTVKPKLKKKKESLVVEPITVRAELKDSLSSPQKSRLVADLIRGMSVVEAESVLLFTRKKAAKIILKVLKSATANAENNNNLDKKDLFVKTVYVNEGIKLPRYRFVSRGRVVKLLKRRSHVVIELSNKR